MEVARGARVAVRDSKDRSAVLLFRPGQWAAFVAGVKRRAPVLPVAPPNSAPR